MLHAVVWPLGQWARPFSGGGRAIISVMLPRVTARPATGVSLLQMLLEQDRGVLVGPPDVNARRADRVRKWEEGRAVRALSFVRHHSQRAGVTVSAEVAPGGPIPSAVTQLNASSRGAKVLLAASVRIAVSTDMRAVKRRAVPATFPSWSARAGRVWVMQTQVPSCAQRAGRSWQGQDSSGTSRQGAPTLMRPRMPLWTRLWSAEGWPRSLSGRR